MKLRARLILLSAVVTGILAIDQVTKRLAVEHLYGEPVVSRSAVATTPHGLITLISDLSQHTVALRAAPDASILLGEPGKGDPVAHPRITLQITAEFLEKSKDIADAYLALQPKASLYVGFTDFNFVALRPRSAFLNGGFGKAFTLTPADLS